MLTLSFEPWFWMLERKNSAPEASAKAWRRVLFGVYLEE